MENGYPAKQTMSYWSWFLSESQQKRVIFFQVDLDIMKTTNTKQTETWADSWEDSNI